VPSHNYSLLKCVHSKRRADDTSLIVVRDPPLIHPRKGELMTTTTSPAVMYARVFGVVLTLVGILGFFVTTNQDVVKPLLGFDVNLTHNLVHLATGVLGLIAGFSVLTFARPYAILLGVVYTVLGVWGLAVGNGFDPFGLLGNVNVADSFLHLAIGVVGIGAWVATRETGRELV
jgi:hypothetical protein